MLIKNPTIKFFCLFVFFISLHAYATEKLILTIDVIRHGDRTPLTIIPSTQHYWTEGLGQLTNKGVKQLCLRGLEYKKELVEKRNFLPSLYNAHVLNIRSTHYNRTINSAKAFLNCLYPNTSIPITTIENSKDKLLLPSEVNPYLFQKLLLVNVYAKPLWQQRELSLQSKFRRWNKLTGFKLKKLQSIVPLGDTLYIERLYHLSPPEGLTPKEINEIIEIEEWVLTQKFKPKLIGNFLTNQLWQQLKADVYASLHHIRPLKAIIYFAHDSTILGIFSGLGIPLNVVPAYGADLRFEIIQKNKKSYIKLIYNGKVQILPHCQSMCSLKDFYKIISN